MAGLGAQKPYNGKCETCGENLVFNQKTHGYQAGSADPISDVDIYDCVPCDIQWYYIYDIKNVNGLLPSTRSDGATS